MDNDEALTNTVTGYLFTIYNENVQSNDFIQHMARKILLDVKISFESMK